MFGNQTLMSGMLSLAKNSNSIEGAQKCAETIWHHYYIGNPQLQRIFVYMLIAIAALFLSIYRSQLSKYMPNKIAQNIPKYFIVIAIVLNEGTMYSWRIERENALEVVGLSYYFQWSPYNPIKSTKSVGRIDKCPLSI